MRKAMDVVVKSEVSGARVTLKSQLYHYVTLGQIT